MKRRRFLKIFGGIFGILASPIVLAKEKKPKIPFNWWESHIVGWEEKNRLHAPHWQPKFYCGKMTVSKDLNPNAKGLSHGEIHNRILQLNSFIRKNIQESPWT